MKACVTGATGLLGNNLVRLLHSLGYSITGLARSREKAQRLLGDMPVDWVIGDVRAPKKFESRLGGRDIVFHTAAYFREYYQPGDHQNALQETNVEATLALMRLADAYGVRSFLHASSSATANSRVLGIVWIPHTGVGQGAN